MNQNISSGYCFFSTGKLLQLLDLFLNMSAAPWSLQEIVVVGPVDPCQLYNTDLGV